MFKKTCWGVKSKERVRFRKLEQLMKALAVNSQNVDPVHRYRTYHQRVSRKDKARCDVSAHCQGVKTGLQERNRRGVP